MIRDADLSIYRALTTINAPLACPIDASTLASCLLGENDDPRWAPHLRSFLVDVSTDTMTDMLIEETISLEALQGSLERWNVEDCDNARWIREMASTSVAGAAELHP